MKKKQIKLILFVSVLTLFFGIFIYFSFKSYNYKKSYTINKYTITESFDKDEKIYTFIIKSDTEEYAYQVNNKYLRKRELINNIEVTVKKDEICILPVSDKLDFYPLCSNKNEVYSYNLSNIELDYKYEKIEKLKETYNKVDINYLAENSYLLYNYKGFYLINDTKTKKIKLFDKDVYSLDLVYQFEKYLLVPDYNQSYYFNTFYLINIINGKVEEINFEQEISFDSTFLGVFKNHVYILDKKEQKEYKLNIKKKKIEEVEFLILRNDKLEETTYKKIVNNKLLFELDDKSTYKIINSVLYQIIDDIKIKISNKEVTKIIKETNDTIYYLSDENLYMYNNNYGEVLLLSNFEWNFNNTNMIFFYK